MYRVCTVGRLIKSTHPHPHHRASRSPRLSPPCRRNRSLEHPSPCFVSLLLVLLLPSSRLPINASPCRHQWHHLSTGSYSPGRCSPTINEARHDHSYVRRNPRGPRRLSRSSPPPVRVWRHSCVYSTPMLSFLCCLTCATLRVSTSSPHFSLCEASKSPPHMNFTSVRL